MRRRKRRTAFCDAFAQQKTASRPFGQETEHALLLRGTTLVAGRRPAALRRRPACADEQPDRITASKPARPNERPRPRGSFPTRRLCRSACCSGASARHLRRCFSPANSSLRHGAVRGVPFSAFRILSYNILKAARFVKLFLRRRRNGENTAAASFAAPFGKGRAASAGKKALFPRDVLFFWARMRYDRDRRRAARRCVGALLRQMHREGMW